MNATNPIENVAATTPKSYFRTAIRTLLAAGAIAIATASTGTALAAGEGLWVANGLDVVEFGPPSGGVHNQKPKAILSSFASSQGVVFDATNNLWVIDGGTTFTDG